LLLVVAVVASSAAGFCVFSIPSSLLLLLALLLRPKGKSEYKALSLSLTTTMAVVNRLEETSFLLLTDSWTSSCTTSSAIFEKRVEGNSFLLSTDFSTSSCTTSAINSLAICEREGERDST